MPEAGAAPLWKEKNARFVYDTQKGLTVSNVRPNRSGDLSLAASFNSRDWTAADWKALLKEADPGFVEKSVVEPEGSALGIILVVWEGKP